MSPKLPHLKPREVVRLLKLYGFEKDHQTGSHAVFVDANERKVTVPIHHGKTIGIGLLRRILEEAGIDPDDVRR